MNEFAPTLYVQNGTTSITGGVAAMELFANSTPEKAMARNLGKGFTPGQLVGVYKLDRVVTLKPSFVEETPPGLVAPVPAAPPATPATPAAAASP